MTPKRNMFGWAIPLSSLEYTLEVFSYLEKWSLETRDHEEHERPLSKVTCKEGMKNLDFFFYPSIPSSHAVWNIISGWQNISLSFVEK